MDEGRNKLENEEDEVKDYRYEELLERVFGILRENKPELSGEKRRTILKPPQVVKITQAFLSRFMMKCHEIGV